MLTEVARAVTSNCDPGIEAIELHSMVRQPPSCAARQKLGRSPSFLPIKRFFTMFRCTVDQVRLIVKRLQGVSDCRAASSTAEAPNLLEFACVSLGKELLSERCRALIGLAG